MEVITIGPYVGLGGLNPFPPVEGISLLHSVVPLCTLVCLKGVAAPNRLEAKCDVGLGKPTQGT